MEEEYVKLIFGLKLKQIRTERNLSLFGLSKLAKLSKSYLNEIEKGKKYPKTDKIIILSEKLDIPYDDLVSLKLDKNLAPIGEILQSKILKEIPLELFGIKESNLIDIIANAPDKVNAFITTIIEVAKHYNFNRESFYLSSLRSYQQSNYNYFDDLEQKVVKFCKAYQIDLKSPVSSKELEEVLVEEYGYTINNNDLKKHKELYDLRSVFVPKTKTLLLASDIDEAQRTFIYAKEIGYNYLDFEQRLYTFPWIKFENFDQVLNNFYASYFAGALLLPRAALVNEFSKLIKKDTFDKVAFIKIFSFFAASPETFYQRLTNLLPQDFNIQTLFFLRFTHDVGSKNYYLTKELHLPNQQSPHSNETNEHYCRRWVSLKVLEDIDKSKEDHAFDIQISQYPDDDVSYLVFSSATKDPFKKNQYRSISIGLLINKQLKKKMAFLEDPKIDTQIVGNTCERCSIMDCKERVVAPKILEKIKKNQVIEEVVSDLTNKFS
ncbi:helix-turn-helix domain-containing protein [Zobellia barbeyronii]|uniref:ImmA/IrrE family metallo-endopeptidase n=1 Tax=Zobellia barbeyronii TaxID=2748009 RepID=A0ABS5WD11_9FLAO|nr:XRE family transcriptional regulator [Zobellia barbeyronii]MBT2161247.1 ImmA/IrrE family metallo-endopeptidase [Zobellia barbeyronii]